MDVSDLSPAKDSSFSSSHNTQDQEQELATGQREMEEDDAARLPRIPRASDDCPQPMTLDELCDWKVKWQSKRRPPTQSEREDYSECDRQWNDAGSETTMDWEEDENYMDRLPSPTQRSYAAWTPGYQARRDARKRPLSPPRTPPHLQGPKLYQHQYANSVPHPGSSRIQKVKFKRQWPPRCPITRTHGTPAISLHHRKGQVLYWHTHTQYVVISYEKYLLDYDREDLDKQPSEPMDFSHEDPKRPHKTNYQREVCRRRKAQNKELKSAVLIPWVSWRGNK